MKTLLLLNFIVPGVMLLVSAGLKKWRHPYPGQYGAEKWKVDGSGYNTPQSRKSQAHWEYAQSIAPEIFCKHGKIALWIAIISTGIGLFLPWYFGLAVGCAMGFLFLILAFMETERTLRDRFPS